MMLATPGWGAFPPATRFRHSLHCAGTVSNGFQAPSLGTEAMQKLQNWNTYVGYTLAVDSAGAQAFGAQQLKPEKSRNYSAGFVAQLPLDINLTLDAYLVDVDNRIALSNQIRASTYAGANQAAVLALLTAAGLQDSQALVASKNDPSLNFFINAANTRTRGLEGTLEGAAGLGPLGRLRWNLSANYNDTTIRSFFQTPASLARYGVSLYTASNLTNLRFLTPRDKEIASLTWLKDRWSVTLRETRYGSMPRSATVTNWNYPDVYGSAFYYNDGFLFITDINAAFEVTDHFSVTAGINNAFDRRPLQLTGAHTTPTALWTYDETGPIDSDGGSYVVGFRSTGKDALMKDWYMRRSRAAVLQAMLLGLWAVQAQAAAQAGKLVDVKVKEGTSMAVTVSPDGRTLAIDLQGSLWTLPATGGEAHRITDVFNDARQPAWSPDGKQIAFYAFRDGGYDLWAIAPDGSNQHKLTWGTWDDREPAWSPDGTRIAFASDRGQKGYEIWTLDLKSGALAQLTHDEAEDHQPSWSLDGKQLVYSSLRGAASTLWTVDAATGASHQLRDVGHRVDGPTFGPDGKVVYTVPHRRQQQPGDRR